MAKTKGKFKKLDSMSRRLEFHYEESPHHRVVKTDGAWGGHTVKGEVQMSIFTETLQSPVIHEFNLNSEGKLNSRQPVRIVEPKKGILRRIEVSLLMNTDVALSIAEWLIERVAQIKELESEETVTEMINSEEHPSPVLKESK